MTFTEIAIIKTEQLLGIQNNLLSGNAWSAAITTMLVFAILALIMHLIASGLIKLLHVNNYAVILVNLYHQSISNDNGGNEP